MAASLGVIYSISFCIIAISSGNSKQKYNSSAGRNGYIGGDFGNPSKSEVR
jgi:hypothetical protein